MTSESQTPSMEELLDGPALDPPQDTVPDFANPGGSHAVGYGLVLFGSIVATIAVLIRLGSRFLLRKIGIADAFMISALGLFAGYQYIIYKHSIFPGIGVHQWNIQLKYLSGILYDVHIASIFYGLGIMCIKIAILIDWLHIFVPQGRNTMFWTLHALIWSNAIFYVAGNFAEIFRCSPREKIWDVFYEGGSCPVNIAAQNFSSGILNLVSDVIILALPQWIIWRLNMSRARKVGLSLLFIIGVLLVPLTNAGRLSHANFSTQSICACATASIIWLDRMLHSEDVFYCMSIRGLWGIGEWAGGFLIMGIPSAPKVFKNMPLSESVMSLIRSFTNNSTPDNINDGVTPPWRKPLSRKRRGLWEISELETHNTTFSNSNYRDQPQDSTASDVCLNIEMDQRQEREAR